MEIEEYSEKKQKTGNKKKKYDQCDVPEVSENIEKIKNKISTLVHPSRQKAKKVHKISVSVIKKQTKSNYNQFN